MPSTNKYLNPHAIFGKQTFDEYCSSLPAFYFKKDVPEDVIKNFEIVEKLLAFSYYEYKFIDEAYAKAIHTLEMAMSIRLRDFEPNSKKETFNSLIIKLSALNLFDSGIETLKHIKLLRNHYSHPERHSFAGIVIWNNIEHITRLINEMYEDVALRLERRALFEKFRDELKNAKLNKSLVIEIQGKPTILFSLELLFINNKKIPFTYLFACTPLFSLETNPEGGSITVPFVFKSKLVSAIFSNNILEGISFTANQTIRFSSINNHPQLILEFENWNSAYSKLSNQFHFNLTMNFYVPEIIIPEIQEFQKM